jgi:tetratricopeptide (TPR) repeat protein
MCWKSLSLVVVGMALLAAPVRAVDFAAIDTLSPELRVEELSMMLGVEDDSLEVLTRLGNAYFDMGETEKAATTYRRALQAGGDRRVVLNLAYALGELGRRSEVDALYREELEKTPGDALLHAFYADFLSEEPVESEKGIRLAVQEYQKAIEIDPKCAEAHFGLGVLFARMQIFKEAVLEWQEVIAIDPKGRMVEQARKNISQAGRSR